MKLVFLFLSFVSLLCANTIVTENDPSTLVHGVSMLTGDLYTFDEDIVVAGAEPISLRRAYLSSLGDWNPYPHLIARLIVHPGLFEVKEANGTTIAYQRPPVSFKEEKKKHKHEPTRCPSLIGRAPGVTNTASGNIAAQTNYQNQYLMVAPDGESFVVFAANGTKRRYLAIRHQEKQDLGFGEGYIEYFYQLHTEELPSGNIIEYKWDDKNHLSLIMTKSPQGAIYASLRIPAWKDKHPPKAFQLFGSDEQVLSYECDYADPKHKHHWILKAIEPPDEPKRQFAHSIKKIVFGEKKIKQPYLEKVSFPNGREISIEYEEWEDEHSVTRHRVKKLYSPIGSDQTLLVSHTFFYFFKDRHSYVIDAKGNKTAYFWNADWRLNRIDSYEGTDRLHSSERFVWEGTNIRCKSLFNQNQQPIWARTFEYDARGNVTVETYFGQLTGKGSPLQIGENGFPIDTTSSRPERCIKKTTYSDDGRNLPLRQEEPGGLIILYEYIPNTNLLKTKILCDRDVAKIYHHYEYDSNHILVREITDDGLTRTIQQITPKAKAPYYGMPEVIEEKYERNGHEILLSKTVLHYGKGGKLEKKDIYDANNVYRYSLNFSYDHKGRVEKETNPLGWEFLSKHDLLGNRTYTKDFSNVETFYDYDASNRLTKKEEVGWDAIRNISTYQYDQTHQLVSETNPKGHSTQYTLTPLGKRAQTHLPPISTETGLLKTPTFQSSFDSAGNETVSTDAEGFSTHTEYNAYGKPIQTRYPDGAEETWVYNLDGTLRSHTDASGVLTTHMRDYLGRALRKTISQDGTILAEETYEYHGLYPTTKTNAEGHRTTFTYDPAGRKMSETYGTETTLFHYDEFSRNHCTEQGSLRTVHQFDLTGRIEETREEDSSTHQLLRKIVHHYDRAGNKIAIFRWVGENQTEVTERFEYDSFNRLISKTDPMGHKETVFYNDYCMNSHQQRVLQKIHWDPMGLQTVETFDTHNQIVKTEKYQSGNPLSFEEKCYNALGKITLQINTVFAPDTAPHSIRTRWEYDSTSRPIQLTEAEGTEYAKVTQNTYTARGEKKTTTKPDGTILSYEYTPLGHLKSLTSSDHSVSHHMRYDKLGNLIWHDGIERKVDPRGRLLEEKFPHYTMQYRYNSMGQRLECNCPEAGLFIEYAYNALDMTSVTRKNSSHEPLYTHTYLPRDLSGNLLGSFFPNNLGQIRYQYDLNSRRQSIHAPGYEQQILETDKVGNILHLLTQDQHAHFTYDELYQITSENGLFENRYLNDSIFSRLQKNDETYQVNDLSQVVSHIEYDKNGNPKRQGDHLYTFDALNRLIQLQTSTSTTTYTYDSQHRRLTTTDSGFLFTTTQIFLYDGQKEIGSLDDSLQVVDLRILGPTPHAEINASIAIELYGVPYVPIHDLCGDIASLLALDGSTQEVAFYSAFGEEINALSSPWRFSSKRVDPTGLVYFGRRFYQPELGRWLSPDPAGFTNGINLYAFVGNCPLTHFDEYGLEFSGFNNDWMKPEPWKNWSQNSWQQKNWHDLTERLDTKPPFIIGPAYSANPKPWRALSANPDASPHYYRNGIRNSEKDGIAGALTLHQTYGGTCNVIPAYAPSRGTGGDLFSVASSLMNPFYMTDSIRRFQKQLELDMFCLDVLGDNRKIFITAFSRGAPETFHTVKNFTQKQRDRLIINACGPTMILPRSLGFKVTNLISKGDWYALALNPGAINYTAPDASYALVHLLPAQDSNGAMGDHFFQSKTYQEGILKYNVGDYLKYGVSK